MKFAGDLPFNLFSGCLRSNGKMGIGLNRTKT